MTTDAVLSRWDEEIKSTQRKLTRLENQIRHEAEKLSRLRIAREEYVKLGVGESPAPSNSEEATTNYDQILRVVESQGRATDEQILEALKASGWRTTSDNELNLIRSYLSRLVRRHLLVRVEQGTYEPLPQSETSSPSILSATPPVQPDESADPEEALAHNQ